MAGLALAALVLAGFMLRQGAPSRLDEGPETGPAPQGGSELAVSRSVDADLTDVPVRRTSVSTTQEQEAQAPTEQPPAQVESAVRIHVRLDGEPLSGLVAMVYGADRGAPPSSSSSPAPLRVPADGEPHPMPSGLIQVALLRADLPLLTAMPKPSAGHVWSREDLTIEARVPDGEIVDLTFELVRGARLYGMVRGADGHGFAAMVRASSDRASYDVETETGEYSLYLSADSYTVTTFAANTAAIRRVKPFPSRVDLRPGDQVALDLLYDQGRVSIVGRWVDQDKQPWTDVIVSAVPMEIGDAHYRPTLDMAIHTARTDEQGAFRLGPLPPGRYGVSPSVLGHDSAEPGGFARLVGRLEVLATSTDTLVDVGERTAVRWVPLELLGKIIAAEGTALYRYRLEVLAPTPLGGEPKQRSVMLRRDGTFTLDLSAHEPLTVTFILTGPEGETREAFSYASGGQMEVTLRPRR